MADTDASWENTIRHTTKPPRLDDMYLRIFLLQTTIKKEKKK